MSLREIFIHQRGSELWMPNGHMMKTSGVCPTVDGLVKVVLKELKQFRRTLLSVTADQKYECSGETADDMPPTTRVIATSTTSPSLHWTTSAKSGSFAGKA